MNVCLICRKSTTEKSISIDDTIGDIKIKYLLYDLNFKFPYGDYMSCIICKECCYNLAELYNFRELCCGFLEYSDGRNKCRICCIKIEYSEEIPKRDSLKNVDTLREICAYDDLFDNKSSLNMCTKCSNDLVRIYCFYIKCKESLNFWTNHVIKISNICEINSTICKIDADSANRSLKQKYANLIKRINKNHFECGKCLKSFTKNTHLKNHLKIHIPQKSCKSYDCKICLKTPTSIGDVKQQRANKTTLNLLPKKSREVYIHCYEQFMDWRQKKSANSFSETVILAYFTELANSMKSSTLWKTYSMLRTTINIKHEVDLSRYVKLRVFLKKQSSSFQPKRSKTFSATEVNKFLLEAPDDIHLVTKVAVIMGIMGACRKNELYQMKIQHVKDLGGTILISIPDIKTNMSRKFTITGKFYDIVKKYTNLRPKNIGMDNFFLNYQKGRCTKQVIGINKLGNMPKQVAIFLKLPNSELYTGHCFKRTSATMLVDDLDL